MNFGLLPFLAAAPISLTWVRQFGLASILLRNYDALFEFGSHF